MLLDLIFWGMVLIFGLLGYFSGFWMQAVRLLVLIACYLLAGPLGKPLGVWLSSALEIPVILGKAAGSLLVFILLYSVLSSLAWIFIRRRRRRSEKPKTLKTLANRLAGAFLGASKTFLLMYVLICAIALLETPLQSTLQRVDLGYERSFMMGMARKHNLLAGVHLPVIGNLETMGKLAADPAFREKAAQNPKLLKLLEHPKIKELLNDPAIIRASESRNISALLANPKFNELLEDEEFQKALSQIDLSGK